MPWMVLALVAALLGGWYAFTHGRQPIAIVLLAVAFGLVFVIGRRIEGQRDAGWKDAAGQLLAHFDAKPGLEILRSFGSPAPWDTWAQGGALQCPRAISGATRTERFALLQVRHPVRAARGEDAPEQWQGVVVAVLQRRAQPAGVLKPVEAGPGYEAADNGEWLFVWKKAPVDREEQATASTLLALLQEARRTLGRMRARGAATPTPTPP
jgi:hypothetical protein